MLKNTLKTDQNASINSNRSPKLEKKMLQPMKIAF